MNLLELVLSIGNDTKMMRKEKPLISILTPVCNEDEALPNYFKKIDELFLHRTDADFEIIMVDDRSEDASWNKITEASKLNPSIKGIQLSRNIGSHLALVPAFKYCKGDAAIIVACDLQDPPETALKFIQEWRKGADIVWGHRADRKDTWWRVLVSNFFFNLIKRFALPKESKFSTGSFFLADRKVVNAYLRHQETHRVTFAIIASMGFHETFVQYSRKKRIAGVSGWTFSKMIKTMYDTFIGFSYIPIRLITCTGLLISMTTFGMVVYLMALKLFRHTTPGWTSQLIMLNLLFGIQFIFMGIMGEYLYRIYTETTKRPLYLIQETTWQWSQEDKVIDSEIISNHST